MAIEVISEITLKNQQDFPIVDANNIRGGIYLVQNATERDSIPTVRRKEGMLCYVIDEQEYYRLEQGIWKKAKFGNEGIPIYDLLMIDELGDELPDKYLTIVNKDTDLDGTPPSREIQNNGTYVDILFSAIRKLLSDVARLKNSFKYGIVSYTDTSTTMSELLGEMTDPDEEPLWAVEEEDLSQLYSLIIGEGTELTPIENVNVSTEGVLKLSGKVSWLDSLELLKQCEDPKLFTYVTSTNLNILFNLNSNNSQKLVVDLSKFELPALDLYNILFIISRKIELAGNNYIYISIGNAQRDLILIEGYYNLNTLLQYLYNILNAYYIESIDFTDLNLSKLNLYSKYLDFSNLVIPSAPSDLTYKFKAAHITIRSVENTTVLESIKDLLLNNELIFVENPRNLWIKNNDTLINIGSGGGSGTDEGMTETEVINLLKEMGIVREDGGNLQISDISDITFIHQGTGNKFKFTVDSNGNLTSLQVPNEEDLLSSRINSSGVSLNENVRGFIGLLRIAENNSTPGNVLINITQDARIYSDRLKIGAFYAPLDTDTVYGCSRAFVELENTADCDFSLEGCYLHFTRPNDINELVVYHLPLTGTIKAGGTYLIVGKKYAENSDANVYIKVDSFDLEWYQDGELIDFTINTSSDCGYGIALTYGNAELTATDYLYRESDSTSLSNLGITSASKFPRIFYPSFIDSIYYYKGVNDASSKGYWADMVLSIKSNTMYKNMFELDPAKLAFQACNTADSSRTRWQSTNDVWIMDLTSPIVAFPHSGDTYNISNFTPKASFENKNISTDKSKLDIDKPNMVSCSFGSNLHTIRCFNWISVGYYNEYVWLRKKNTDSWTRIESYKQVDSVVSEGSSYPRRKEYSKELNNAAYARITGRFPGDNTFYTSHKCVIKISQTAVSSPETWEYVVGRATIDGTFDVNHSSEVQTFTLYPESYKPVIYHITDQQGFHWVEYQVWAAAAIKVLEKIKADQESNNIIPVIINTGDMTLNGTRINEWFDYYQAGRELFKEYESMNVVGNNDLCGTDTTILGTGDDQGKSNSFYFHVCYCYDIDESVFVPVVNGKYIPSLYFFDSKDYRFIMINTEITSVNCQQWFNLTKGEDIVNIYTGYTIGSEKTYYNDFTSIYTMIYHMLDTTKYCIAAGHEMPFTVITNDSIASGQEGTSRSLSTANALVGSHTNQISNADTGKGTYWLSRLLEYKKCKLMIGGHKHTYACTYPLREYFLFGSGKNSKDNYSEYSMEETLENDNVTWESEGKNLTKFPLTKRADAGSAPSGFYPYTPVPDLEGGVTYFMCQATGYKLTSNKELPSANLKFSLAVPQTSNTGGSDKASDELKYPMFGIIELDGSNYDIKLARVANIFNSNFKFAQNTYSTDDMKLQYFVQVSGNNYGKWQDTEAVMLSI